MSIGGEIFNAVMYGLDTPGALTRGLLANAGDMLTGRDSFQGYRATGDELVEAWGWLDEDEDSFGAQDAAGFAADMLVDPLNLLGAGLITKGLKGTSYAAKAAKAADTAGDAAKAADKAGDASRAISTAKDASPLATRAPSIGSTAYSVASPVVGVGLMSQNENNNPYVNAIAAALMGAPLAVGAVTGAKALGRAGKQFGKAKAPVTSTPEFKKWFGASKVVDEAGAPKVMYHGTAKGGFEGFNTYSGGEGLFGSGSYFTDNPDIASAYTKKGAKGKSGQSVYPVYMKLENPMDMDAPANVDEWSKAFYDDRYGESFVEPDLLPNNPTNEDVFRQIQETMGDEMISLNESADIIRDKIGYKMGYDGITHIGGGRVNTDGPRHRVYVAFEPEQIKSATGNRGTFDPASANIRYSMLPPAIAGLTGYNVARRHQET